MAGPRLGISVILASSGGVAHISRALSSLAVQTLEPSLFEIICCLNGDDDGTRALLDSFHNSHPDTNLVILHSPVRGLAHARNMGLLAASYSYFTNLDDDDWISPRYLEELLKACAQNMVVMTYICDVSDQLDKSGDRFSNYLSRGILPYAGQIVESYVVPVGSADGGKAASTELACNVLYDEDLRSGLDVVFWSQLVVRHGLRVRILRIQNHAFYYRLVRSESMSRLIDTQYIEDRYTVTARLRAAMLNYPEHEALLRRSISGQVMLLGRVAEQHPEMYGALSHRLRADASDNEIAAFNHSAARTLAICYVYTPYNDASAIVAAKRLAESSEPFDVISHNMAPIRVIDRTTLAIDSEYRGKHTRLSGPPSSTSWYRLAEFCQQGSKAWEDLTRGRAPYTKLYSRAQWPFSHALAALIKARQPDIHWVAEFSDPISIDIDGHNRPGVMGEFQERKEVEEAIRRSGFDVTKVEMLHEWVEMVAYTLADEIMFTNENQKIFMASRIKDPLLVRHVTQRAVIASHPPVPDRLLKDLPSPVPIKDGKIHLGYFGRYYKERGIDDILTSLQQLPKDSRKRVIFHVYVPEKQVFEVRHYIRNQYRGDNVRVGKQMNYTDFLRSAKSMDWLLVIDSKVTALHGLNPYLPSKYSEYLSLGTKIWGIIEPGSPLSQSPLDAMSLSGHPDDAWRVLMMILNDRSHPD